MADYFLWQHNLVFCIIPKCSWIISIHRGVEINEYWTKNFLPVLPLSDFGAQVVTSIVTTKKYLSELYILSKKHYDPISHKIVNFLFIIKGLKAEVIAIQYMF